MKQLGILFTSGSGSNSLSPHDAVIDILASRSSSGWTWVHVGKCGERGSANNEKRLKIRNGRFMFVGYSSFKNCLCGFYNDHKEYGYETWLAKILFLANRIAYFLWSLWNPHYNLSSYIQLVVNCNWIIIEVCAMHNN